MGVEIFPSATIQVNPGFHRCWAVSLVTLRMKDVLASKKASCFVIRLGLGNSKMELKTSRLG
jgi:hypothetical protein